MRNDDRQEMEGAGEAGLPPEEGGTEVELPLHQQWYEQDPARLDVETALVEELFPEARRLLLRDGRLCFVLEEHGVCAICGADYPLSPACVRLLVEGSEGWTDEHGGLDLFTTDPSLTWDANASFIADLLERALTFLRIADMTNGDSNHETDEPRQPDIPFTSDSPLPDDGADHDAILQQSQTDEPETEETGR